MKTFGDWKNEQKLDEKAPPGWSGTVTAMRKHHSDEIDNPYALAWSMKNKGDKPHYKKTKDDKSTGDKVPDKKEKYKDESMIPTFTQWLEHKLSSSERKDLKGKDFAEPGKKAYPIEDKNHARNALARVSQFGSASEKKKVRAAVHRKYPDIGEK